MMDNPIELIYTNRSISLPLRLSPVRSKIASSLSFFTRSRSPALNASAGDMCALGRGDERFDKVEQ